MVTVALLLQPDVASIYWHGRSILKGGRPKHVIFSTTKLAVSKAVTRSADPNNGELAQQHMKS